MDDLGVPPWLRKPPIYTYWDNTISHDYGTNPITRMICETSGYQTCEGPPTSIIGRLTLKKWVGYWNSWSISKSDLRGFPISEFPWNFPFYGRCFWHFQWKSSRSLPKEGVTSFFYAHNSLSCKKVYILYDIIYILLNSYNKCISAHWTYPHTFSIFQIFRSYVVDTFQQSSIAMEHCPLIKDVPSIYTWFPIKWLLAGYHGFFVNSMCPKDPKVRLKFGAFRISEH